MADRSQKEQAVIEELKRVADLLGKNQGSALSRSEFTRHSKMSSSYVERIYGTWSNAAKAVGLVPGTKYHKLQDDELQQEFSRVCQQLGKIPTRNEFAINGRHSPKVYENRFESWGGAVAHYSGKEPEHEAPTLAKRKRPMGRTWIGKASGRMFGRPLNFRELRHEPTNEQGVVFLFGMVAKELGFLVEAVAQGYPDCVAKRQIKGRLGQYEAVNIEFEFKSSNFRHDPSQCDLIVCWEHDWAECPIEVIELKTAIKDLPHDIQDL
jgi:hypothetical protein